MEAFLFKNEVLYFLHNNEGFLNFVFVFIGTHGSFLCGQNIAVAQLLMLVLKIEEMAAVGACHLNWVLNGIMN